MTRRRKQRRPTNLGRRQKQGVWQLLMAAAALAMLLAFWTQLSEGAAGCFGTMVGDEVLARPDAETVHDAPGEESVQPKIRVQVKRKEKSD